MTPEEILAEALEERAALRALPAGVEEVQFGARRTTMASMEKRAARLAELDALIEGLQNPPTTARPRMWYLYGSKGT